MGWSEWSSPRDVFLDPHTHTQNGGIVKKSIQNLMKEKRHNGQFVNLGVAVRSAGKVTIRCSIANHHFYLNNAAR